MLKHCFEPCLGQIVLEAMSEFAIDELKEMPGPHGGMHIFDRNLLSGMFSHCAMPTSQVHCSSETTRLDEGAEAATRASQCQISPLGQSFHKKGSESAYQVPP